MPTADHVGIFRCGPGPGGGMLRLVDFAQAVDAHLATVTARDLPGYLATVHDDVSLIMPTGRLVEGREAVGEFHREWFDDPDWSWSLTPLRATEAGGTGVALYAVAYDDVDGTGEPYTMRYLLSLTFTRSDGRWL